MERDQQSHAIIGAAMEVHRELGFGFRDFLVETKAIAELTRADDAQLINELKATGLERGLLLNFGTPSLQFKRLVLTASGNLRKSAKSADNLEEIVL
jgi:hypothetical protein